VRDAIVIPPQGEPYALQLPEDGNAELRILQQAVEGWIEGVPNPHGVTVYCNEEGKIKGLPPNYRATHLFGAWLQPFDIIAGNVIVCGPPDDEGENTSLEDVEGWISRAVEAVPVAS
jgi:hypothetical protein